MGSAWSAHSMSNATPPAGTSTGAPVPRCTETSSIASGNIISIESSDPSSDRTRASISRAASTESMAASIVVTYSKRGTRRRRAAVITASVPSEPASNDGQWSPTVSFGRPASDPTTVPSASTASTPTTCWRMVPNRTTLEPPAFVAIAPPTVAESRAAKSIGVSMPPALAARCQSAIVTPAPVVTCIDEASMSEIVSSRRIDNTMLARWPAARGTLAPTSPVLPA